MDWITHAAVGAAVGEIMLGKRIGNPALAWGALFGIAPEVADGVVELFLSTTASLAFQTAATHSPVLAALLVFLLPRWLAPRWKRAKVPLRLIRWFIVLSWAGHLLVDCLSLPGVQCCWPFPAPRVGFNVLGTGDAVPGILLGLPLVALTFLRTKKEQAKRRRLWWWGVGLAGGYLGLALAAKWAVSTGFANDLARRGTVYERRLETPTPWNVLFWRGVVDRGDEIWIGYRSVFEWPSSPVRWTVLPRDRAAFATHAAAHEARRMAAFSNGWWLARPNKTGLWLADVRYGEARAWGVRKGMVDLRFTRAWHFEPLATPDPVHALRPEAKSPGDTTRRLVRRTFGQRDAWEASPRLAGVPGALPEPLRTED
jgi:inner membrane protein